MACKESLYLDGKLQFKMVVDFLLQTDELGLTAPSGTV